MHYPRKDEHSFLFHATAFVASCFALGALLWWYSFVFYRWNDITYLKASGLGFGLILAGTLCKPVMEILKWPLGIIFFSAIVLQVCAWVSLVSLPLF